MYPKLKINVYFIFLNIGDLTFGITLVKQLTSNVIKLTNSYPSDAGKRVYRLCFPVASVKKQLGMHKEKMKFWSFALLVVSITLHFWEPQCYILLLNNHWGHMVA
jgi:hypothetical protein